MRHFGNKEALIDAFLSTFTLSYILADYLAGHMALEKLHASAPFALVLSFIGMLLGLGFIGPHS